MLYCTVTFWLKNYRFLQGALRIPSFVSTSNIYNGSMQDHLAGIGLGHNLHAFCAWNDTNKCVVQSSVHDIDRQVMGEQHPSHADRYKRMSQPPTSSGHARCHVSCQG